MDLVCGSWSWTVDPSQPSSRYLGARIRLVQEDTFRLSPTWISPYICAENSHQAEDAPIDSASALRSSRLNCTIVHNDGSRADKFCPEDLAPKISASPISHPCGHCGLSLGNSASLYQHRMEWVWKSFHMTYQKKRESSSPLTSFPPGITP